MYVVRCLLQQSAEVPVWKKFGSDLTWSNPRSSNNRNSSSSVSYFKPYSYYWRYTFWSVNSNISLQSETTTVLLFTRLRLLFICRVTWAFLALKQSTNQWSAYRDTRRLVVSCNKCSTSLWCRVPLFTLSACLAFCRLLVNNMIRFATYSYSYSYSYKI